MITYAGYRKGKYMFFESDSDVLLYFTGMDADKFEQAEPPSTPTKHIEFALTVADCRKLGLFTDANCTRSKNLKRGKTMKSVNRELIEKLRVDVNAARKVRDEAQEKLNESAKQLMEEFRAIPKNYWEEYEIEIDDFYNGIDHDEHPDYDRLVAENIYANLNEILEAQRKDGGA